MRIVIEFYRTRTQDEAHAVVGRETVEAANLGAAIRLAHVLVKTLDMPQQPDAITITGTSGGILYSGALVGAGNQSRKLITMNANNNTNLRRSANFALGVWENEGGAPGGRPPGRMFGRRIEADRSWTVYHVFSGVPAHIEGRAMVGLSQSDATDGMTSLNLHDTGRRNERIDLSAGAPTELMGCQG